MWTLGSIAGSSLGGFTAQPARFYPSLFSKDGLFGEFPYLLPNLIAVGVILIAIIQAVFLLEETNPAFASDYQEINGTSSGDVDETTPLQGGSSGRPMERRASQMIERGPYVAVGSLPIPNDPSFDLRRGSFGSIGSFGNLMKSTRVIETAPVIDEDGSEASDHGDAVNNPTSILSTRGLSQHSSNKSTMRSNTVQTQSSQSSTPSVKAFNREVMTWMVALFLMCYHQMAFGSVLPIYVLDDPRQPPQRLDLLGGLGLTLHDVGKYLAVNSILALIIQSVVFPIYVGKVGVWMSVVTLTLFCPLVHLAMPFVSLLPDPGIGVFVVLALQSFSTIVIYPSLLILLKNATPSPLVLGKVNGLAMSLCSGARTISPPLVGIIYSSMGSAAAWWSCALFSIAAAVELCFISRPKDSNEEILRRASIGVEDE